MSNLWEECLTCRNNCCNHDIASTLFVTDNELNRIKIHCLDSAETFNNGCLPCPFLKEDSLCDIHPIKPIDCRLFPFDLVKEDDRFFWIVRQIDCPITVNEENFENYLRDFEENIIPDFDQYMEEYALFRYDELAERYGYKVLREVKHKVSLIT